MFRLKFANWNYLYFANIIEIAKIMLLFKHSLEVFNCNYNTICIWTQTWNFTCKYRLHQNTSLFEFNQSHVSNLDTPQWNGNDASNKALSSHYNRSTEGKNNETSIRKRLELEKCKEMVHIQTLKHRPNYLLIKLSLQTKLYLHTIIGVLKVKITRHQSEKDSD